MSLFVDAVDSFGESQPDALAFVNSEGQRLTYGELASASNALARKIASQPALVAPQSPVAVYGHKSPMMVVAFLACAKSGHAFVVLDTSLPLDRIASILEQLDEPLVIDTEGTLPERARDLACACWHEPFAAADAFEPAEAASEAPDMTCVSGEDTLYILFTSGSTGVPKGVEVSAANADAFLAWMKAEYPPRAGEVFFDRPPFTFDLGLTGFIRGLGAGATMYALERPAESSMKATFEALSQGGVTYWESTPSFAEMCLADPSFNQDLLPQLDTILLAGETLRHETARQLIERFPNCQVVNGYGPTEATILVSVVPITYEMTQAAEALPVGMPVPHTEFVILDPATLQPMKAGEEGELFIVGDTVAKGYFNRPEATQAAFGSYPFDVPQGTRAYRTGDRCFLDASGMLHFRGRLDFQVKLHGYRIELGDIESNLCLIDGVRQACVLYVDRGGSGAYLRAFVQLDDPSQGSFQMTRQLKAALRELVPDYMVPRTFTYVEEFPLNVNGKIDRAALRDASANA